MLFGALHTIRPRFWGNGPLFRGRSGADRQLAEVEQRARAGLRLRSHLGNSEGHRESGGHHRPRGRAIPGELGEHGERAAEGTSGLGHRLLLRMGV